MNIVPRLNIPITTLLLLALCTDHALAMTSASSSSAKSETAKSVGESKSAECKMSVAATTQCPALHRETELKALLYDILDPMPEDLINIINKYDQFVFRGENTATLQTKAEWGIKALAQYSENVIIASFNHSIHLLTITDKMPNPIAKSFHLPGGTVQSLINLTGGLIAIAASDMYLNAGFIYLLNPAAEQEKAFVKRFVTPAAPISITQLTNGLIATALSNNTICLFDPDAAPDKALVKTMSIRATPICVIQLTSGLLAVALDFTSIELLDPYANPNKALIKTFYTKPPRCNTIYRSTISQELSRRLDIRTIMLMESSIQVSDINQERSHRLDIRTITQLSNKLIAALLMDGSIQLFDPNQKTETTCKKTLLNSQVKKVKAKDRVENPCLIQLENGLLVSAEQGIVNIWDPEAKAKDALIKRLDTGGKIFSLTKIAYGGFAVGGKNTIQLWQ